MRCAVLADAWRRASGGRATVYGSVRISFVEERLHALGIAVEDFDRYQDDHAILVVDSYSDRVRMRGARAPARLRVLVDDTGNSIPPSFGIVWNPNAYGSAALYPDFSGVLITGVDAVPIRDGLGRWNGRGSSTIGLTIGGGTASALIRAVVAELHAALGSRPLAASRALVPTAQMPLDAASMWRQLAACAAIVCASGSTLWEAAAVGVPVVVVAVAENQLSGLAWAKQQGVPTIDLTQLNDARSAARSILDALALASPLPRLTSGAGRVADRLARYALATRLQ